MVIFGMTSNSAIGQFLWICLFYYLIKKWIPRDKQESHTFMPHLKQDPGKHVMCNVDFDYEIVKV